MTISPRLTSTRVGFVAAALVVGVLGNMRPVRSEAAAHAVAAPRAEAAVTPLPVEPTASPPLDDSRVVPGIYAWDPDVRVIYLRHISKWM